jgi:hypothetical protein
MSKKHHHPLFQHDKIKRYAPKEAASRIPFRLFCQMKCLC